MLLWLKIMMKIYFFFFNNTKLNKEMMSINTILSILFLVIEENNELDMKGNGLFLDYLSTSMIILTLWMINLMIMSMYMKVDSKLMTVFLILAFSVISCFCVTNIFMFYLFFEFSLLPILILVIGWGYQFERMKAGLSLFFYTLFASLPLLVIILYLNKVNYFFHFFFFKPQVMFNYFFNLSSLLTVFAFFVKLPIYFFHLWLAKAHVEAPVSGSMFLAGILLKLGGYGLLRFSGYLILSGFMIKFCLLALWGGSMLAIVCLRLMDMKVLIAYSSVVHMAMIVGCSMWNNMLGVTGSIIMMLAHGLCSAGMFAQANMFYLRTHSRNILLNKGQLNMSSFQTIWWFMLILSNFGGPFTFNLLGEILMISSLINISYTLMIFVMFISGFSAAYCLVLYSTFQQGVSLKSMHFTVSLSICENLILLSVIWPLFMLCLMNTTL